MAEYIERETAKAKIREKFKFVPARIEINEVLNSIPAADVRPVPEGGIGEMSDGYHTFNGLYYQRMILFAALVKAYRDKAWKSHRHEDGELCFGGGWFIVGIDTPEGSYTYHYDDTVWDFFDCEELPTAKHWDGHTEKDVTRLLSLDAKPRWILPDDYDFLVQYEPPKPKSNADRIRDMTDEELADWLGVYCNGQTAQEIGKPCVSGMGSCKECWLDWLREEVSE